MEVGYRRDLNHSYAVLDCPGGVDTASYQVRMVLSNHIQGLLTSSIRGMDGKTVFCYEVTSKQSMKSMYEHINIDYKLIVLVFQHIFGMLERLEQFLLDGNGIILEPELIFINPEVTEIYFCFLPGEQKDIRLGMRQLIEYMLPKIDHQDQEAVLIGYGLYRKIMEEHCPLEELKRVLGSQNKKKQEPAWKECVGNPDEIERQEERNKILDEFFSEEGEEEDSWKKHIGLGVVIVLVLLLILIKWIAMPGWFFLILAVIFLLVFTGMAGWKFYQKRKEKEDLRAAVPDFQEPSSAKMAACSQELSEKEPDITSCYEGETEIFMEAGIKSRVNACLYSVNSTNKDCIELSKDMMLAGKLEQAVDICLKSNAVSRIHGRFSFVDGNYYLSDMSSKNGTYVNGNMLLGAEERRLENGDEIRFADLIYTYQEMRM